MWIFHYRWQHCYNSKPDSLLRANLYYTHVLNCHSYATRVIFYKPHAHSVDIYYPKNYNNNQKNYNSKNHNHPKNNHN